MAKLLANRLSETMTAAQIAQFQRGIQMAMDALPKKPVISNEEYAKIPKKGDARRKWADQMLELVRQFPKYLPTALQCSDVEKDNILNGQIHSLNQLHLRKVVDLVEILEGLSGGEELNAYSRFIENVRTAAKDGQPDAIEAQNQLDDIEHTKTGPAKKKSTK
jgi:hypothetical protein